MGEAISPGQLGLPAPEKPQDIQRAPLRPGAWGLVLPVPSPAGQRRGLPHPSCHRPAHLVAQEPRGLQKDAHHPAPRRASGSCRPGKWAPLRRRPAPSRRGRRAPGTWREPWSRRPRRPETQETPAADKGPGSPAPPWARGRPPAWPAPPSERLLIWSNDTRGSPGGARLSAGPAARTSAAVRRLSASRRAVSELQGLGGRRWGTGEQGTSEEEGDLRTVWLGRSEERRVGKECRSRWSPYH